MWEYDLAVVRLGTLFGPWEYASGAREVLSPPLLATRLALAGERIYLSGGGQREWLYTQDMVAGVLAVLDGDSPRHDVYNLGSGMLWDMAAWCTGLAARLKKCRWKVVENPDKANVVLYAPTDRAPMAHARLSGEFGYQPQYGMERAQADFLDWLTRHEGLFADEREMY